MRRAQFSICCVVMVFGLVLFGENSLSAQQQPDPYGVYHVGNGVAPPRMIYRPEPQYSDKAREKKLSGTVRLAITVTTEGLVKDVKVSKGLEKSLDRQAVKAVSRWKFEPATLDGKAVPVYVEVEVTFNTY